MRRQWLAVGILAGALALVAVPRDARAGGFFGFSIGVPLPVPVVPVAPAPVYVPAPVPCPPYVAYPVPGYVYGYGGYYRRHFVHSGPPYGPAWGYYRKHW